MMFSSSRNAKNQQIVYEHLGLAIFYSHCLALLSTCNPWLEVAAALLRLTFTLEMEKKQNYFTILLKDHYSGSGNFLSFMLKLIKKHFPQRDCTSGKFN